MAAPSTSEKLYTKCRNCEGKGCNFCGQDGYEETGLTLAQVDRMKSDLKAGIFPGWTSHEEWVMRGRTVPTELDAQESENS
jgi:hypothetical protein